MQHKKIVVFGKGFWGKKIYILLSGRCGLRNVEIWDNIGGDVEINGKYLLAKLPHTKETSQEYQVIITPIRYYKDIVHQLEELMFDEKDYIGIYDLLKKV